MRQVVEDLAYAITGGTVGAILVTVVRWLWGKRSERRALKALEKEFDVEACAQDGRVTRGNGNQERQL